MNHTRGTFSAAFAVECTCIIPTKTTCNKRFHSRVAGFALPVLASIATAQAQVFRIDFETLPGGAQVLDGMTIGEQFHAATGASFRLQNGEHPVLARIGPPRTAFQGFNLEDDAPAPGTDVGSFFLTDDGVVAGPPSPLLISFDCPITFLAGVLIDIDGEESWIIEALNAGGQVVSSVSLPPNNNIDGSATPFQISTTQPIIHQLRIRYDGSQSSGVGLAFDNFVFKDARAATIEIQPVPATTCPDGAAGFSITATGGSPLSYQWQWQQVGAPGVWTNLTEGPNADSGGVIRFIATGTTASTVTITRGNLPQGTMELVQALRCTVSNTGGCSSVTSNPATLTISPCGCSVADIVAIGGEPPPDSLLTGDDFNAFIAAFANDAPLADIVSIGGEPPPDGLVTGDDFNAFIAAFANGCP